MSLKSFVHSSIRRHWPALWHWHAYRRYLHAAYGEREIHFLHEVVDPARHAIDIGAYEGMYSKRLGKLCRGVFGFEANPDSAGFCRAALGRSATIYNYALSDAAGSATLRLPVADAPGAEAALGTIAPSNTLGGRAVREITVPAARLDDFDLPPVGFIKIDVEGHEEAVLRGAQATIARNRPALMIEIEERHNPGAIGRIFERFRADGFTVRCVVDDRLTAAPSVESLVARAPSDRDYVNNFFFVLAPAAAMAGGAPHRHR